MLHAFLMLILCAPARSAELVSSWLSVADGLPTSWTSSVVQDGDDTMWIGGPGWVARYDGERMESVRVPRPATIIVLEIVPRRGHGPVIRLANGEVFEWDDGVLTAVTDPTGQPLRAGSIAPDTVDASDAAGVLVAHAGGAWRWSGEWEPLFGDLDGEPVQVLGPGADGTVWAASSKGWFRWRDGVVQSVLEVDRARAVASDGASTWLASAAPLRVWHVEGVRPPKRVHTSSFDGAYAMDTRAGSLWLSDSVQVARIDADGRVVHFDLSGGRIHGPVTVDRAGSLWGASFDGLLFVAEPGLERWSASSGLSTSTARFLVPWNGDLWVGTWAGTDRIDAFGRAHRAEERMSKGPPCPDASGHMWVKFADAEAKGWRRFDTAGGIRTFAGGPDGSGHVGCTVDREGRTWAIDGMTVFRLDPERGAVEVADVPIVPRAYGQHVLATEAGWLWAGVTPTVCGMPIDGLEAGSDDWMCHDLPGDWGLSALHETERGNLWAVQRDVGVLQLGPSGFEPIADAETLGVDDLRNVSPSPRGGQWLTGLGSVVRVVDRKEGPRIVESIPDWIGRTVSSIESALEDDEGALWLASNTGVVKVPAELRGAASAAPGPRLRSVRIDGRPSEAPVSMGPGQAVSVEVAAAAYQAPRLVRYRYRLDDGPWSAPTGPLLTLRGMAIGRHSLEVASSLDGVTWSTASLTVPIEVVAPWWQRTEVWLALGLLLALAGLGLQTARIRARARAEQLRSRVAMDLHDELGAGLASMGLLAGVIAQGAGERGPELADRIASDAHELGAGLSGIVWSLRPGHDTVGALLDYVAHRARALVPHLERDAFTVTRDPAIESIQLDLDVLRAVQLVSIEALANVARHAEASRVEVSVHRQGGGLLLVIADDGIGLEASGVGSTAPDRGLGLQSMEDRMARIGGRLELISEPGQGTWVSAWFRPRRRWWDLFRGGQG